MTLYKVDDDYEKANPREWGFHTARVNCLGWSPDSNFVASGGLDCNIIIWSVQQPEKHLIIKVAHTQSQITGIKWLDGCKTAWREGSKVDPQPADPPPRSDIAGN